MNIIACIGALGSSVESKIDVYARQDAGSWMHYGKCSVDGLYWSLSSKRGRVARDRDRCAVYPRVEVECIKDRYLNIVKTQSSVCRKPVYMLKVRKRVC